MLEAKLLDIFKTNKDVNTIIKFGSSALRNNNDFPSDIDLMVEVNPKGKNNIIGILKKTFVNWGFLEYEDRIVLFSGSFETHVDIHLVEDILKHKYLLKETLRKIHPKKMILYDRIGITLQKLEKVKQESITSKYHYHKHRAIESFLLALKNLRKFDYYSAEFHLFLLHKHLLTLTQPSMERDYLPAMAYERIQIEEMKPLLKKFSCKIERGNEKKKLKESLILLEKALDTKEFQTQFNHLQIMFKDFEEKWFENQLLNQYEISQNKQKILILGMGYMGLISGLGLAITGHSITFADIDKEKVERFNSYKIPFYEKHMEKVIEFLKNVNNYPKAKTLHQIEKSELERIIICVGTPTNEKGKPDLSQLMNALKITAKLIRNNRHYTLVIIRSTVPPTTCRNVVIPFLEEYSTKEYGNSFGVAMIPEFLKEGNGFEDFLFPDRVIIGTDDKISEKHAKEIFRNLQTTIQEVTLTDAEIIKYSSNAFLATKISFINEIANLVEKIPYAMDFENVREGIVADKRINPYFFRPGIGFGGSCFKKDIETIIDVFKENDLKTNLLPAVLETNAEQHLWPVQKLQEIFGDLNGKTFAILGLTFKPNTDDVRNAPSITISKRLIELGCKVKGYDPKGNENAKQIYPNEMKICGSVKEATELADAIIIATEWEEFRNLQSKEISPSSRKIIIDGRRILKRDFFKDWKFFVIGGNS